MKNAVVTLQAGEFPHSIDMIVELGSVVDMHYHITQKQAQTVLQSVWHIDPQYKISDKSDPFIKKLLGVK